MNWGRHDVPPPTAEPIPADVRSGRVVIPRDEDGLAFGGIGLAEVDAPAATNTEENSGPELCRLYGSHQPSTAEELASKYPTHDAYVRMGRAVANRNLREGFVLQRDAAEAEASRVGTPNPLPIP